MYNAIESLWNSKINESTFRIPGVDIHIKNFAKSISDSSMHSFQFLHESDMKQ